MRYSVAQYKKWLEQNVVSIRKFNSAISYFRMSITKAEKDLPALRKQIAHYEKMLPEWGKDLAIEEKSLKRHLKHYEGSKKRYELAAKIDKMERLIHSLDKQIAKTK